ncbi:MAG: DUF4198 domain-containing protein [Pseudomonadota bacterium]
MLPSPAKRGAPARRTLLALFACAGALLTVSATAHDLVVKPGAPKDAQIPLDVLLTEVFFTGDVLLKPDAVSLQFLAGGQKSTLDLTPDPTAKALTARVSAATPGAALAKISRTRPAREEAGRPSEPATLSENTSKALVNLAPGAAGFATVAGERLEIIPLTNPAEAKVGEELALQVLFDGKPLPARVFATYDGFSTREGTFATTALAEKDGTAHVKITAPGLWVVKVSHSQSETAATHGRYSANANLVFQVK